MSKLIDLLWFDGAEPLSQFEAWWLSQDRLKNSEQRFAARLGWTHAFKHTLTEILEKDQGSFEYSAAPFKHCSSEPFSIGHNAAVELIAKMLNDGDYPGYE